MFEHEEDEDNVLILEPPGATICNCGDLIGYIELPKKFEAIATVHPCHCNLTHAQFKELLDRNHPEGPA